MKSFKKIIASLLAASLSLAMSVSTFAFDKSQSYTYEVSVENEKGEAVESVAPGSDIYLALYVYRTDGTEDNLALSSKGGESVSYGFILPLDALASKYALFDDNIDEYAVAWDNEDGDFYINGQIKLSSGNIENFEFSKTKPIVRTKLTVSDVEGANFDVTFDTSCTSIGGSTLGACKPQVKTPDKFSIKAETVSDKPANGDEIGTTNGKKIYYANTVTGTFNKNTGFVVKYTGDDAKYKGKYEGDCKDIKATLGDLLGGKIGEGSVTGNLHFGIVLKDTSLEAATIPGFQVETK